LDKIIIKNLTARGIIGVNKWERDRPQEILMNIVVYANTRKAAEEDDIQYSVNYRTIAKKAQSHAETAGRISVEALAEDIARLCLEEPNAQKVRVRVEKPSAVRFAESVGVEIVRKR